MAIDASIPLSIRPPQFMQPVEAMSLRQVSMQMQEQERKQQEQNELKKVLQDPQSLDPKTGNITTIGLNKISQINPITSMQIQQQQDQRMAAQVQRRLGELSVSDRQSDLIAEDMTAIYGGYQDMVGKKIPPEQATQRFRENLAQKIRERELSGLFTPEQIEGMRRINSPDQVPGVLMGTKAYKDYLASTAPKIQSVAPGASLVATPPGGGTPTTLYTAPEKNEGAWGEPYQLGGAMVQKNAKTGEIRQAVSRPPVTNVINQAASQTFNQEDKLRADYTANPNVKAAAEMQTAFKMIEAAKKNPSAANDLAMATKYMKILDPTSVVRESEFALAVQATGLLDKVKNYAASVLEGKKLNPTQREDFYNSAKAINDAFQKGREDVDKQYGEMAKGYGLNPKNVIPSLRTPARRESDAPGNTLRFDAQGNRIP